MYATWLGLSRMDKAFIHLFRDTPPKGIRLKGHTKAPNILVYVDVLEAVKAGVRFFECTGSTGEDSQVRN